MGEGLSGYQKIRACKILRYLVAVQEAADRIEPVDVVGFELYIRT